MKKDKKVKFVYLVALLTAILSLTLGYAAFSTTLKISSTANVIPNAESFKLIASGSKTDINDLIIEPEITGGATADDGVIENKNGLSSISSIVNFTVPGQIVSYTAYLHNSGKYDANLKKLEFASIDGMEVNKVCVAKKGTRDDLVQQACESISIKMTLGIGTKYYTYGKSTEFSSIGLENGAVGTGIVTVSYENNAVQADGPFSVKFGNINLYYSTAS